MVGRVGCSFLCRVALAATFAVGACEIPSELGGLGGDGGGGGGSSAPTEVRITTTATTVDEAATLQLAAEVMPFNAPQTVLWSTSDQARATIDGAGLLTARALGPVTVTATSTANPALSASVQITVVCRTLTQAAVTNGGTLLEGTCYTVQAALSVNQGTLTVLPGVRLSFGSGGSLSINTGGRLSARGSEDRPIVFTSLDAAGSWLGISFNSSRSADNVLRYVSIENAGSEPWTGDARTRAAVFLTGNTLVDIQNSTISGSRGQGIDVRFGAEMIFRGNTLRNNAVAAWVHPNSVANIFESNVFQGNTANVVRVGFANTDLVSTGQIWQALTVPYEIQDRVGVHAPLTILEGARVTFRSNVRFDVVEGGSLTARGTEAAPIVFTSAEPLTGYWLGISIETSAVNNIFEHVIFENGGSALWTGAPDSRAMVYMTGNSKAIFRNSTFRGSGHYGLWVPAGGDISGFEGNRFTGNARTMIVHPNRAGSIATNNVFTGNNDNRVRVSFNNVDAVTVAQLWQNFGTPFYVMERTSVRASLTIDAGTVVDFAQGASLSVVEEGSLRAAGVPGTPVTFRGDQDLIGYWLGIQYHTASSNNTMTHTLIENAGSGQWTGATASVASIYIAAGGSVNLANVTFRRSGGYAIFVATDGSVSCAAVDHGGANFYNGVGTGSVTPVCP